MLVEVSFLFMRMVQSNESFRVAKVCQILEQVLQLPNIALSSAEADQLINWLICSLEHSEELILLDILNCLAAAVHLKEMKQAKVYISRGILSVKQNNKLYF